jgi:hypothetical protein
VRPKLGKLAAVVFLTALAALAANFKLYLKDGSYHVVREYKVDQERVRFYSVERSEWEEIPLDLADLKRTEAELKQHQAALQKETKALTVEDEADRRQREKLARVPQEPGVYLIGGAALTPIKQAESKAVTDQGRRVLKILSPVPLVTGRVTVELDGERSANIVPSAEPEFYFRLALNERFAILKLGSKKGSRVVQTWHIAPVTNELLEEDQPVANFNRQLDADLYRIWPKEPLKPGEYAVVEYTAGQRNIQVWDFAYRPSVKP